MTDYHQFAVFKLVFAMTRRQALFFLALVKKLSNVLWSFGEKARRLARYIGMALSEYKWQRETHTHVVCIIERGGTRYSDVYCTPN